MIRKIREATGLLAANWILFSSIVLTVWLPGSILLVYLRLYVFPETTGGDELRIFAQEVRVSNAIELAFGPIYVGAVLHAASRLKQSLSTTYIESMSYGAQRSFKLLKTRIGTGLIVLAGLIAFIIPGVALALRFALIDAVVVLEGVEGTQARNLSVELTEGRRWNILGAVILSSIGVFIAVSLVSFSLYLPLSMVGQDENFIVAVIIECVSSVLLIVPTLVLFLFYWNVRRRETPLSVGDERC